MLAISRRLERGLCLEMFVELVFEGRQNSGVAVSEIQNWQWIKPGKQKVKKIIQPLGTHSPVHQSSQLFICSCMRPLHPVDISITPLIPHGLLLQSLGCELFSQSGKRQVLNRFISWVDW